MVHYHVVYVMAVDIMSLMLEDVRFEVKVVLFCGENVPVTVS